MHPALWKFIDSNNKIKFIDDRFIHSHIFILMREYQKKYNRLQTNQTIYPASQLFLNRNHSKNFNIFQTGVIY